MKPQTGDFVEGLRNRKTQKLFICLEAAASPGKVRVINPGGDILVVMEELFDLEPVEVLVGDVEAFFTGEQVTSWRTYLADEAERRRLDAEREARLPSTSAISSTRSESARRASPADRGTSTPRAPRKAAATPVKVVPGRIAANWASERLVFYRHRIDPLRPSEQFQVKIQGVGTFQITKADFQRIFNNVIMSPQYRSQGMFSYEQVPDEAMPFIRPI
jgi:hypothetical protein